MTVVDGHWTFASPFGEYRVIAMNAAASQLLGAVQTIEDLKIFLLQSGFRIREEDGGYDVQAALRYHCYEMIEFEYAQHMVNWVDYSDDSAVRRDAEDSETQNAIDPRPALAHTFPTDTTGDVDRQLSNMLTQLGMAARDLSQFLYAGFAATSVAYFHGHTIFRKLVPSLGGRHGLDAFLMAIDPVSGKTSWSYYDPVNVHLTPMLLVPCDFKAPAGVYLVICADFRRYMWRYRNSRVYLDVYYDLGHVMSNLKLNRDIKATPITSSMVPYQPPGMPELLVEPIAVIRLSAVPPTCEREEQYG